MNASYLIRAGLDEPIAAAAVHDGHALRANVAALMALDDAARLREEDPYTAALAEIVSTQLIGLRSRFEVDLNRPRDKAVYRKPEDAWGLGVWRSELPERLLQESLAQYDAFYADAERALRALAQQWGRFVVLDLHSYNHRRAGPDAVVDDPALNPEINIGTGTMDRLRWSPVVDALAKVFGESDANGRRFDVRENVKFHGGQFSRWVHETFPDTGCSVAIEFRKSFMDEWTGVVSPAEIRAIHTRLTASVPVLRAALAHVQ